MTNVKFSYIMFAYSMENETNPDDLIVCIPDVFIDQNYDSASSSTHTKQSNSIFKNAIPPALSNTYTVKNYMRLPVIKDFAGTTNVVGASFRSEGSRLYIDTSGKTKYPINVGIGEVKKGDKLIVAFINENPQYGYIIARA